MLKALRYYRPTRTPDGEGGWTTTLGEAQTVYAALAVHDAEVTATVRSSTPLRVGDLLEAGGALYEVVGFVDSGRTRYVQAMLQKRDRPTGSYDGR